MKLTGTKTATVTANGYGQFTFTSLPNGTYTVTKQGSAHLQRVATDRDDQRSQQDWSELQHAALRFVRQILTREFVAADYVDAVFLSIDWYSKKIAPMQPE